MKTQSLPCSEKTLYKIASLTASHLKKCLTDFTNFSPAYTTDSVADIKTKLEEAKNIPSGSDRKKDQLKSRDELVLIDKACNLKWKTLKVYIMKAYEGDVQEMMLDAAGAIFNNDADKTNWEKTSAKMDAAVAFLNENGADMVTKKVMPTNFAKEFKAAATEYEAKWKNYLDQLENTQNLTSENRTANITLYSTLADIYTDGKIIYSEDDDKRKLFTFDNLVKMVENKSKTIVKKPTTPEPILNGQPTEGDKVLMN